MPQEHVTFDEPLETLKFDEDVPRGTSESLGKRVGRGALLGGFSGLGIPESEQPLSDLLASIKADAEQFLTGKAPWYRYADPTGGALTQAVGMGRDILGSGKEVYEAAQQRDPELAAHGVASLATRLALLRGMMKAGTTPVSEGAVTRGTRATVSAPKTALRSLVGIGEKTVERARTAAEEAAEAKRAAYEKRVSEARSDYEAKAAQKQAAYEERVAKAKQEHEQSLEATKRGYGEAVSRTERAKIAKSRLEGQKRSLEDVKDRYAEQAAQNLDKAEAAEKANLDQRYADFRQKYLGVSPENPNGTLQAEMTPVGQAVLDARRDLLKGSKTNITIFNDMIGRLKEVIEAPDGTLKPLEGQTIPVDQLRGYITELNERLYESELPGDVRDALKHVRDASEKHVQSAIEDVHGKAAGNLYRKLKSDYNDYMDTWRDIASGSPLPRIRRVLRSPMATKRGIPVYREVGRILEGTQGEKAIPVIARKRVFGADPNLPAKLRAADARLSALPKSLGRIPIVKRPEFPKMETPKPPRVEPFEPEVPPEIKPFDPQQFRSEQFVKAVEKFKKFGWDDKGALVAALVEVFHGNLPLALSYPVLKRLLGAAVDRPSVQRWLSK